MKPLDDKQLFLDMQEHPELYSDDQLEAMMTELDKEPDIEAAWQKTLSDSKTFSDSPLKGENFGGDSFSLRKGRVGTSLRRIAAIVIAVASFGVLSLAGYRAFSGWHKAPQAPVQADSAEAVRERFYCDVQDGDTIFRFENIRLDSILAVVSRHYDRQVVFKDEAPKHLRLFVTCRTSQSLREFVETLNMFDGINVTQEFYMLYVESDERKEDRK